MLPHKCFLRAVSAGSFALLVWGATPAVAQFGFGTTVYDPSAVAQLITEVSNQVQMLNQMVQQVQQGQAMLSALPGNGIVSALANLSQQTLSLTNSLANIGATDGSLAGQLIAQYPTDFSDLQSVSAILTKLSAMQTQTRDAMQASMALQNQVATNQAQVAGNIATAVSASNGAIGPTAALQATNQLLATLSQQLTDLQSILIAHMRAEDAARMNDASQQAAQGSAMAAFEGPDLSASGTAITNY